jgi:hypothetical protein
VPLACIEVRSPPRRGGALHWEPLADRSSRAVQLTLSW